MSNLNDKIVFTDGPSFEFKNKYITKFVSDVKTFCSSDVVVQKYFTTSLGQGSPDGVGGRAKSLVRTATKSKKSGCVVQSSEEFASLVTKLMPGMKVMHVSDDETNKLFDEQKPWENVKNIPGILKTHCIVCEKKDHVKLYTDDLKDCLVAAVQHCSDDEEVECVADVEMKETGLLWSMMANDTLAS